MACSQENLDSKLQGQPVLGGMQREIKRKTKENCIICETNISSGSAGVRNRRDILSKSVSSSTLRDMLRFCDEELSFKVGLCRSTYVCWGARRN